MSVVTVTPNPSVDRTLEVDRLLVGEVNRAHTAHVDPGGKGVNVARALAANGVEARAVVPLGGREGDLVRDLLKAAGIEPHEVPVAGATRTNVAIVSPDGAVTKVNAAGRPLSADELDALRKATIGALDGAAWLTACGSLPPGAPDDLYADLVTAARRAADVRVAVDTSGAPLERSLAGAPDLVKPNAEELEQLTGRRLRTLGDVLDAAAEVLARDVGAALVSLGADGAVLVDAAGALHATSAPVTARSTVGAGDATLAGFVSATGGRDEALVRAVAFGAAAVRLPGSAMPGPDDLDLDGVDLRDVDPDRRLTEGKEPG